MNPDMRAIHRLRGGVVGALSASTAVGAHGLAAGSLPATTSLLIMTAACTALGWAIGATSCRRPGWFTTMGLLASGQLLAHASLTALDASSSHHTAAAALTHAPSHTMLLVHAIATLLTAAAIGIAEPALLTILTAIVALIRAVLDPPADDVTALVPLSAHDDARPRLRAIAALDTRGPPALTR
ncbi:hypothetical protein GTC6_06819 [Gordonia terrae C-6]|uniref:Uncharacterized protein n=1 Tax=Gordonia terrae C-6 TaxID=1316928 RepID=R7YBW9_9ACTN|nr:hypothetical protein [Gordonia terrae]EON33506.1 hypothetical protein GTC6_06819 [Gordonia terrae C-6]